MWTLVITFAAMAGREPGFAKNFNLLEEATKFLCSSAFHNITIDREVEKIEMKFEG